MGHIRASPSIGQRLRSMQVLFCAIRASELIEQLGISVAVTAENTSATKIIRTLWEIILTLKNAMWTFVFRRIQYSKLLSFNLIAHVNEIPFKIQFSSA